MPTGNGTTQGVRLLTVATATAVAMALSGCSPSDMPVAEPGGPIALAERDILIRASWIMLIVILPVIVLAFWFSWRYRASNTKARYEPDWMSVKLDAVVWAIPTLIVTAIAVHVWIYTHELDPYKPIDTEVKPLEVQAVAQDWKWLFIYPEQNIATVNELAFPAGVPLSLKITSDTVMNSFFVPALAGQIYAMAGMQTQLNLMAGAPGRFVGRNSQYSGTGFADQQFEAIAMSEADFDAWVEKVKQSGSALDAAAYAELAKPSEAQPVSYYTPVEADLFDQIIAKYDSAMTSHRAMAAE